MVKRIMSTSLKTTFLTSPKKIHQFGLRNSCWSYPKHSTGTDPGLRLLGWPPDWHLPWQQEPTFIKVLRIVTHPAFDASMEATWEHGSWTVSGALSEPGPRLEPSHPLPESSCKTYQVIPMPSTSATTLSVISLVTSSVPQLRGLFS
jgi:hypothetical protein